MKENNIKTLNIYERLDLITNEIATVAKNLKVQVNQTASYQAVSERDIIDAVKPIEHKYRVYSYPFDRNIIDNELLIKESEYNGKVTKTNSLYMRVETIYRFVNIDKPEEYVDIKAYGDGIDTGDKAPGKAVTYADKYALMKAYKISTGDDPDKEASPEEGFMKVESKATARQLEILKGKYQGENLIKLLNANNIEKIEDLPLKKASELISKLMKEEK